MSENAPCDTLVISYLFPPSDDVSGIVQAKRILVDKERVDIVVSDSGNDSSVNLANFVDEYINDKIIIEMGSRPVDYNRSIMYFTQKAMETLENKNADYKSIYSICWRLSNHFLALEYKLKHPDVFWTAEFSDPMLFNTFNRELYTKFDYPDYIDRINSEISKLGNYPLIENPTNTYFIVEYLTYLFADKVIFTNENQREIMLSQHPVDVYDMVMEKSGTLAIPTLDEKYYHISEQTVELDENDINIAYFGAYYPNRNFESIFYAFETLNHKFKDRLKFHFYVFNKNLLKELISGLDIENNLIMKDIVDYFDFLNLTTKFDVLIVNDVMTKGYFKVNPYRPSKISDYEGSGNDIWAIYENGSVMSREDVKYKSDVGSYAASRDVLVKILEDYGFGDDDYSFDDEEYIEKRMTLLNEAFSLKNNENIKLKRRIRKLKAQNKKLKKKNDEILSSKSWRITEPLRKLKKL